MHHPIFGGNSDWDDVLKRAAASVAAGRDEVVVFLDGREDLKVEFSTGGDPAMVGTAAGGAAIDWGGRSGGSAFISSPTPERLLDLVRSLVTGTHYASDETAVALTPQPDPDSRDRSEANRIVSGLMGEIPDRLGAARLSATGRLVSMSQAVKICRPDIGTVSETRSGTRIRLDVLAFSGGRAGRGTVETTIKEDRTIDAGALVEPAVRRAVERLEAREVRTGRLRAVMAPGAGGILIHELIGHALEGDICVAGRSELYRERLPFASTELVVVDDPRRGRVSWKIDDEGEEAGATPLIIGGKVAGLMHDRRTAALAGERTTGHGRRASYVEPVMPRMGCTFMGAGDREPEDIITDTAAGLFVRRMEAASVDPAAGSGLFRVSDADMIVNGKISHPLEPFMMQVSLNSLARGLDMIGNDPEFDTCVGSCLRDGQPLATSVGAPTFRAGIVRVLKEKSQQ